jgi:hypothetical protein
MPRRELRGANDMLLQFHTINTRFEDFRAAAIGLLETIWQINNAPQQGQAVSDSQLTKRKRVQGDDPSYRPPKSRNATKITSPYKSHRPGDERENHNNSLIGASNCIQSPCPSAEDITAQDSDSGANARQENVILRDCARKGENSADHRYTSEITRVQDTEGSIGATSNGAEQPQSHVLSEPMLHTASSPSSANFSLATPTKPTEGDLASPRTEEIPRGKIPISPESIALTPHSMSDSSSAVGMPKDLIYQAVEIIYLFRKYQHPAPREVYLRIMQTLGTDNQKAIPVSNSEQWSDGSTWVQLLDMGFSEKEKVTIFNMLAYMGAYQWYDKQIALTKATALTKKNKPVDDRGAAKQVLDNLQRTKVAPLEGTWISRLGQVTVEELDETGHPPTSYNVDVSEAEKVQRKRIINQLSRGKKLTKLVRELGFGILLSPNIWWVSVTLLCFTRLRVY